MDVCVNFWNKITRNQNLYGGGSLGSISGGKEKIVCHLKCILPFRSDQHFEDGYWMPFCSYI